MKRRVSHRQIFETPDSMLEAVNAYFEDADNCCMPYTISGLCLAIGFSRDMLLRSSYDSVIGDIINQAKLLIEQQHEILLLTDHKRTAGVMFALKNLGWSDQRYLDIGISGSGAPGDKDQLKWTVEVIAPGEDGNPNKRKHKIKEPPPELEYHPPMDSSPPPVEIQGETLLCAEGAGAGESKKQPSNKGAAFAFALGDVKPKKEEVDDLTRFAKEKGLKFRVVSGKAYPRHGEPGGEYTEPVEVSLAVESGGN